MNKRLSIKTDDLYIRLYPYSEEQGSRCEQCDLDPSSEDCKCLQHLCHPEAKAVTGLDDGGYFKKAELHKKPHFKKHFNRARRSNYRSDVDGASEWSPSEDGFRRRQPRRFERREKRPVRW